MEGDRFIVHSDSKLLRKVFESTFRIFTPSSGLSPNRQFLVVH